MSDTIVPGAAGPQLPPSVQRIGDAVEYIERLEARDDGLGQALGAVKTAFSEAARDLLGADPAGARLDLDAAARALRVLEAYADNELATGGDPGARDLKAAVDRLQESLGTVHRAVDQEHGPRPETSTLPETGLQEASYTARFGASDADVRLASSVVTDDESIVDNVGAVLEQVREAQQQPGASPVLPVVDQVLTKVETILREKPFMDPVGTGEAMGYVAALMDLTPDALRLPNGELLDSELAAVGRQLYTNWQREYDFQQQNPILFTDASGATGSPEAQLAGTKQLVQDGLTDGNGRVVIPGGYEPNVADPAAKLRLLQAELEGLPIVDFNGDYTNLTSPALAVRSPGVGGTPSLLSSVTDALEAAEAGDLARAGRYLEQAERVVVSDPPERGVNVGTYRFADLNVDLPSGSVLEQLGGVQEEIDLARSQGKGLDPQSQADGLETALGTLSPDQRQRFAQEIEQLGGVDQLPAGLRQALVPTVETPAQAPRPPAPEQAVAPSY